MSIIRTVAIAAALTAGVFSARAEAATITIAPNTSTSFEILWSQMAGGTEMTALGEFAVGLTNTYVEFVITLTNDTNLWNQRIHSLGFNTSPNGTGLTNTVAGNYFGGFGLSAIFPDFQRIDICAWTSGNCAGGAQRNNLPGLGTSDTFGFRLNGNFSQGVVIEDFAIRFMGDLGSFNFEGEQPTASVPEPASLLLMGMGLSATAFVMRRRRQP